MAEARRLKELAAEVVAAADIPSGASVVAVSGGADSAALLWTCVHLGLDVRAVHVHHGLPASDLMADAAAGVAASVGIEIEVIRVVVGAGASPENQARTARYRALAGAAGVGEWVLTGHTSDDQAETVLAHFLRASGLDGLRGIPARRGPYVRPFLGVTRSQTRELATLAGLAWRDDPANEDLQPLRNRIRRSLIPHLEASYNPALRRSLAITAELVAGDVRYLNSMLEPVVIRGVGGGAEVAAAIIHTAHPSLAARLARRLLEAAGLPAAPVEAVDGVLSVAAGETLRHQPGGDLVVRRRGAMVVAEAALHEAGPVEVELQVPGITRFGPWRFEAMITGTGPPAMPIAAAWMVADAETVGRLRIVPASSHPGLTERLSQGGVSASERATHPVVVGESGPVWIPMVRRLGAGWVVPATDRYLVVFTGVNPTCLR